MWPRGEWLRSTDGSPQNDASCTFERSLRTMAYGIFRPRIVAESSFNEFKNRSLSGPLHGRIQVPLDDFGGQRNDFDVRGDCRS